MDVRQELAGWLRVHAPALWLVTREERRALELLRQVARDHTPGRKLLVWTSTRGLREQEAGLDPATVRLTSALEQIHDDMNDGRIVALLEPDLTAPAAGRALRDALGRAGPATRSVVVIAPRVEMHPSLEHAFIVLPLPPPDPAGLLPAVDAALDRLAATTGVRLRPDGALKAQIAVAGRGMTEDELTRTLLRQLLERGQADAALLPLIQAEKCRRVASHPLLRLGAATEELGEVGGMASFKEWLTRNPHLADDDGVRRFRGLLLVGLPGCGQSVSVRAAVKAWGLPLIHLDGMSLSPASEAAPAEVERALAQVEACEPCVLWISRIDSAFLGDGDQGGRAATAAALVLEAWLLDRGRRAIAIATARDPERLPLTMVVRGAFDKIFFLDFPNSEERRQILRIILARRGVDIANLNLEMLVAASDGFSGAQVVQAIDRGLLESRSAGEPLRMVDVLNSLRQATPMAGYLGDARRRIKAWAHRWALSASSPRDT